VDDSVVRLQLDRELVLRRARGYAPLPLKLHDPAPVMLAVGAHLKNTVALAVRDNVFISQHIGDLETREASEAFHRVITSLETLYEVRPEIVVADMHPDYLSTKFAYSLGLPVIQVQHHYAHIAACMAENELKDPVLGVSWDGTGFGLDGTVWCGEFLVMEDSSFRRAATFRGFRLPGGTTAIREPRRAALGLLYEMLGDALFERHDLAPLQSFSAAEAAVLHKMLAQAINSPRTSSVGRLFDAVASIAGLHQQARFEGQAAMALEFALAQEESHGAYPFELRAERSGSEGAELLIADWEPAIRALFDDLRAGVPVSVLSARFHETLVEVIVEVARRIAIRRVALSGGCFQNMFLTERAVKRLEFEGFQPYWHQRIPPNDGGIAAGQIFAALRTMRKGV
jgi:hydrogenase maturation protein HypF